MRLKKPYKRTILIMIGDLLIIPLSYVAGYYLRLHFGIIDSFTRIIPLSFLIIMTLSYLLIFYFFDLYDLRKKVITPSFLLRILLSVLAAAVLISFLKYSLFLYPIGRGVFIFSNLILFLSVFFWRGLCHHLFKYVIKYKRSIIIGTGDAGQKIAEVLKSAVDNVEILGFLDDKRKKGKYVANLKIKVLDSTDDILSLIEHQKVNQIIVASPEEMSPQLTRDLIEARLKGVDVINMLEIYQIYEERIPIDYIKKDWFLKKEVFEQSVNTLVTKIERVIDIFTSSLILFVSFPLWLAIAFLIKINSKGPVFYTQQRVGINESIFYLYKFRSMVDKAEKNGAVWAEEEDKRVTFVGKFLRKLHLDELPQLLNVIKGDISLVGPRPERPEFVKELNKKIPYYSLRHFTKPGLTGWAQVNYPYAASFKDTQTKLEYDLYYISHKNLLLNLRILLKTVKISFFRR